MPSTGSPAAREIGGSPPKQWQGIYLAKVVNVRTQDLWVQLQVPQVMGTVVSNWAAPIGQTDPVPPVDDTDLLGKIVLAMFLGGDINQPLWIITSQKLR